MLYCRFTSTSALERLSSSYHFSRARPAMSCVCYFWSGSVDLATSTYVNYDETRVFFEKSLGGFPLHTSCNTASQKHNLSHFSRLLKSTSWIALLSMESVCRVLFIILSQRWREITCSPNKLNSKSLSPKIKLIQSSISPLPLLCSRHSHVLGCCIQKIEIDHPPFKPSAVRIHNTVCVGPINPLISH